MVFLSVPAAHCGSVLTHVQPTLPLPVHPSLKVPQDHDPHTYQGCGSMSLYVKQTVPQRQLHRVWNFRFLPCSMNLVLTSLPHTYPFYQPVHSFLSCHLPSDSNRHIVYWHLSYYYCRFLLLLDATPPPRQSVEQTNLVISWKVSLS